MTDEIEVPLYLEHSQPLSNELLQKIKELIQNDKIIFEPAYTIRPDGKMEIKHISINPRFKPCSEEK